MPFFPILPLVARIATNRSARVLLGGSAGVVAFLFKDKGNVANKAESLAKKYGIKKTKNGIGDTFDAWRHAYTSAVFTFRYGDGIANALGEANEVFGNLRGQTDADENMDLWNNRVGREIGLKVKSEKEIESVLFKALNRGE